MTTSSTTSLTTKEINLPMSLRVEAAVAIMGKFPGTSKLFDEGAAAILVKKPVVEWLQYYQ